MNETNLFDGKDLVGKSLQELIRSRLIGVDRDDQDLALDDADWERIVGALDHHDSDTSATDDPVLELARLACDRGASFDVTYEADGAVRVSLYPVGAQGALATKG